MSVNLDPPIQLQPDMPKDQSTAFINQNFQAIANAVNKKSFTIVLSGTYTFASLGSVGGFLSTYQDLKVAHNLGSPPSFMLFAQMPRPADYASTAYAQFPATFYVDMSSPNGFYKDSTDAQMFNTIYSAVDSTYLYVTREASNGSAGPLAASAISIIYYVLQQSAS